MKSIITFFSITIIALTLNGCITQNSQTSLNNGFSQPASYYLQQAQKSSGLNKQTLLLQATAAYFYYNQFAQGRQILYRIQFKQLDNLDYAQYQLLAARLALHDKQAKRALAITHSMLGNATLTRQMQIELFNLRANAQQQLNLLVQSIKTRIQITPLLNNQTDIEQNQLNIWAILTKIPNDALNTLSNDANDSILRGWASLALITRQYANQAQQLLQQLRYWQSQFPNHPAIPLVSTDIKRFQTSLATPKQIALLLPLQGPLAHQAEAILNGFLLAYYRAKNQQIAVPIIKLYDTTTIEDISKQYQQAIDDGADFVVGPLTKANVQLLKSNGKINVPTLALNYATDDLSPIDNLYEFALSPESEAIAAANYANQFGYQNAATITPAGTWGKNVVNAFVQQWQTQGGKIVSSLAYPLNKPLKNDISILLNINQSNWRHLQLQKIIDQKLRFSARRRQDIDMIFLNAFPQTARQIIPLLRFYYAGSIPVFATSQIYSGIPNAQRDKDLNGVRFTIMPWVINPSPRAQQIRQQAKQLWPTNFKQNNLLYAFGLDAYALVMHMGQLHALAKFGFKANTGILSITKNHRIQRKLEWAEFKKGIPTLLKTRNDVIAPLKTDE